MTHYLNNMKYTKNKPTIYKISGYLVDFVGGGDSDTVMQDICEGLFMSPRHLHIVEKDLNVDDVKIRNDHCDLAECEKYFKGNDGWSTDIKRSANIRPGQKYKHFKGKIIEIVCVSQDTEMPGQFVVVYKDKDGYLWHRPLGMFLSEVDHVKYPEIKQKWRFEEV